MGACDHVQVRPFSDEVRAPLSRLAHEYSNAGPGFGVDWRSGDLERLRHGPGMPCPLTVCPCMTVFCVGNPPICSEHTALGRAERARRRTAAPTACPEPARLTRVQFCWSRASSLIGCLPLPNSRGDVYFRNC
jgi:hypothetical protein